MQLMTKEELSALESLENEDAPTHNFSAGDWVLAPWSEDGQYVYFFLCIESLLKLIILFRFYEAQVEDITSDGQCTVMFTHTKKRISEVCLVGLLKPLGKKRSFNNKSNTNSLGYKNKSLGISSSFTNTASTSTGQATNFNQFKKQQELRDAQRRKQQKRKEKIKQLEDEREKDKMKWQSFANKVIKFSKYFNINLILISL